MPTKFVYVDGTAVHYIHGGRSTLPGVVPDLSRGELLVFLHDAGGNAGIWRRVAAILDGDHSTVAFDFPGHGRSGGTESLATIDAYAEFFASFVRALGLRAAILVGHGMGAAVAVQTARHCPGTVRALALVGAARHFEIPQESIEAWRQVMQGRTPQPFTTEAFSPKTEFPVMREAWMEQVKTDPRVRYFDLAACAAHDVGADAAKADIPALIVAGNDDRIAPPDGAEQLRQAFPSAELVTISDAGHLLPLEKPAAVAAAITSLLSGLADTSDQPETSR